MVQEPQPIPTSEFADVESVDSIISALYNSISFGAGEQPDSNRLRSLFMPGAHLIHVKTDAADTMDVETFIDRLVQQIQAGILTEFIEAELARHTKSFGNIAQVFSTFETRLVTDYRSSSARGIHSIQLMRYGDRWWITNLLWDDEQSDKPIPAKYLPEQQFPESSE
ncbi:MULTISPECIES: hypothetical protein [Trichocoleus]|uniref:SnoaL-like domain-containing protein n=1 Tax=Trichocoleus desertorum GB2-A4 TaxID=2933944 RepID=A0ABV0J269_9CYAN|nr:MULTISPECIES: hypothetical protein [unclassified Trichocoleus]MBD1860367.1 hypothetical protein [Trichocoleus sp. FACHB-46]MBD2097440.1 hypothetical protein [Trichocoleus sp. FACHB-591]